MFRYHRSAVIRTDVTVNVEHPRRFCVSCDMGAGEVFDQIRGPAGLGQFTNPGP